MHPLLKASMQCLVISSCIFSSVKADNKLLDYPEGYRHWSHIKSMVIQKGHPLYATFGGMHHIYANDNALQGYESGSFPNGSIIVFDLLEVNDADHAIVENTRKVLSVMQKDSQRFTETAGWSFEGFAAGDPAARAVGENYKEACYACHTAQKDNDYVFSKWRD